MTEWRIEALATASRESPKARELFLAAIAEELYRHPRRYGFDDEDAAAEALLKYRPRILGLVERYVSRGSSFTAYLATSLRFMAKTLRRERCLEHERAQVCETAEAWTAEAAFEESEEVSRRLTAEEAVGSDRPAGSLTRSHRSVTGNRLIFLFLKCAWHTGDEETKQVARATGVSEAWLAALQAQSRRFMEAERLRHERLTAWRDRSWSRQRYLELRLSVEIEPSRRRELEEGLERARADHAAALAALAAFRPVVPNSIVARILGVPKGTVDSGLYYLKRHPPCCAAAAAEAREGEG